MTQQEGVIKFTMEFTPTAPFPWTVLRELNAWRKILYLTQLIGQDPTRYEGYGYGNISQRVGPFEANQPPQERPFMISGTQTGNLAELKAEHYACVLACYPEQNRVVAEGPIRPSSESMTHGMLYALDENLRFVMHAHSPEIWRHANALEIAMTSEHVSYGSPEMAQEVARLFRDKAVQEQGIFGMAGHEDGIITFGKSAKEAGGILLNYLARSFALSKKKEKKEKRDKRQKKEKEKRDKKQKKEKKEKRDKKEKRQKKEKRDKRKKKEKSRSRNKRDKRQKRQKKEKRE